MSRSPRSPAPAMPRTAALLPCLAAALAAALPPPSPPRRASPPDAGRPVVLVVHGRGLLGADTAALRRTWGVALDDGVRAVAGHGLLGRDDLRLVWYADALDPGAAPTPCDDGGGARPARSGGGWARDVGSTLETVGSLMTLAAAWLGGPEADALTSLAGDLVYLGDDAHRCGAGRRLADALDEAQREGRPVILVTHSFGALVAYDHLRTRPPGSPGIERWITVGSLLGHPELRELLLAGGGGSGLPAGVASWVNVRDPRDPLAAPLVDVAGPDDDPDAIQDRRTEAPSGGDAHEPDRYLADPATARAVLEAWCAAARDPDGTAACRALTAAP